MYIYIYIHIPLYIHIYIYISFEASGYLQCRALPEAGGNNNPPD